MKMTTLLILLSFTGMMSILSQKLVSMGAILLSTSLITTILTSFYTNSWYAFILFLIYVTGLLVLFGYFLALSPNTYMTAKKCFKAYSFMALPALLVPHTMFMKLPPFKMAFEKDVISLFSSFNMPIYWLMTIILLMALLMVVSLTYKSPSPLRNYLN